MVLHSRSFGSLELVNTSDSGRGRNCLKGLSQRLFVIIKGYFGDGWIASDDTYILFNHLFLGGG